MSNLVNNTKNIGYNLIADDEIPTTPTRPIDAESEPEATEGLENDDEVNSPPTDDDSDPVSQREEGVENIPENPNPTPVYQHQQDLRSAPSQNTNWLEGGGLSEQPKQRQQPAPQQNNNNDSIIKQKHDYLYELKRMEKKGIHLPQIHHDDDSLDAIKSTYERVSKDARKDKAVKRYMTFVELGAQGIEALDRSTSIDLYMKGFTQTINYRRDDFIDCFEDLHEKYGGKSPLSPEMNLVLTFVMAMVTNIVGNVFEKLAPGLGGDVVKNDPNLMKQFLSSAAKQMSGGNTSGNEPQEGSGNMMENLMSQFMNQGKPTNEQSQKSTSQQPQQQKQPTKQGYTGSTISEQQKKRSESKVSTDDIEEIVRKNDTDTKNSNGPRKKKSSRSIAL